jgi:hypothetical protein
MLAKVREIIGINKAKQRVSPTYFIGGFLVSWYHGVGVSWCHFRFRFSYLRFSISFTQKLNMKKLITLFIAILSTYSLFAQAPQRMTYQAVIRNTSGNLVVSAPIKMRISILQGSATGTSVYSELHNPTTNANGLVTIEIGGGTSPQGTFSSINWGSGTYFLKTEADPANGTNYSIVGTSQLLSVPYALQANNAGNGFKSISDNGDTLYLSNGQKFIRGTGSNNLVLPTITTKAVAGITSNSATFGGTISNANGNQIMEKGIVYSTSPNPTLNAQRIIIGSGIGTFDTITSMSFNYAHFLQPNTKYFVRAYAITENNISAYGNEVTFSTAALTPPAIVTNVTGITSNSATFGGNITSSNGNLILERGFAYSTIPNPTIDPTMYPYMTLLGRIFMGSGIGTFDSVLSLGYEYTHLLNQNTTYYVRAYAYTENGNVSYGNEVIFKTLSIGQTGPGGGIVFFDKGNTIGGWRYLEAAPNDQSTGIGWGCNGISIPGTKLSVGSGEANTGLIVAGCNEASYAAKLCDNLTIGGQSDWFLPSIDEINLMYNNLHQNSKGNFSTQSAYWSSTEAGDSNASFFYFNSGEAYNFLQKDYKFYVRAVRAF